MRIDKILKLAERFYNLTKEAGIVEDMAARVLYSTIPVGTDDELALRSLVPGAKRMLHYGGLALIEEIKSTVNNIPRFRIEQGMSTDALYSLVNKLEPILNSNKVEFFSQAAKLLGSVDAHMFGGPPWIRIATALKNLAITVNSITSAPNKIQAMKQMVADMNIIDGMAHNTGLLMDKMLDLEATDKNIFDLDSREARYDKLIRIMDAKEMARPEDVMRVVAPVVEESMPEVKMPFNDVLSRYRSSVRQVEPEQPIEPQLDTIRTRKNLMELRQKLIDDKDNPHAVLWVAGNIAKAMVPPDDGIVRAVNDVIRNQKESVEPGRLQELVNFILTRLDTFLAKL